MIVLALLSVNEEELEDLDSTFSSEMCWVEDSGIYLRDYVELSGDTDNVRIVEEAINTLK